MPTNKLWIEHTERAAWDSVDALRERLTKAEQRLQALASGVERVPQLLDLLDDAKQRFAPDARGLDEVVAQLIGRVERLQTELDAAKAPPVLPVSFAAATLRPRLEPDDLDAEPGGAEADDDLDLSDFAQAVQRRNESVEASRDMNRLLTLTENKLDDLTELEGAALREAALDLAILAGRIYEASKRGERQ